MTETEIRTETGTCDEPVARLVNRPCRVGLILGAVSCIVSFLVLVAPVTANASISGLLGSMGQANPLLWISGCEIVLAGAAIGASVVGLWQVSRSKGAQRGVCAAGFGIALGLGAIGTCLMLWMAVLVTAAAGE